MNGMMMKFEFEELCLTQLLEPLSAGTKWPFHLDILSHDITWLKIHVSCGGLLEF